MLWINEWFWWPFICECCFGISEFLPIDFIRYLLVSSSFSIQNQLHAHMCMFIVHIHVCVQWSCVLLYQLHLKSRRQCCSLNLGLSFFPSIKSQRSSCLPLLTVIVWQEHLWSCPAFLHWYWGFELRSSVNSASVAIQWAISLVPLFSLHPYLLPCPTLPTSLPVPPITLCRFEEMGSSYFVQAAPKLLDSNDSSASASQMVARNIDTYHHA